MEPEEGARRQIELYRRMSGEEKLGITFSLWEMTLSLLRASERAMHPELDSEAIEDRVRKRIAGGAI
jgi:hypothetical protein